MAINAIKNSGGGSAKLKKLYIYTEGSDVYIPTVLLYQPFEVDYINILSGGMNRWEDGNDTSHYVTWTAGVYQINDTVKELSGTNLRAEVYLK